MQQLYNNQQSNPLKRISHWDWPMQQYQQFWHDKLSQLDSQLLVDFDTFMNVFCQQIYKRTSIILTDLQKQCIKAEIDPQNQNQVYKNGYLLFVKNFWGVASNRTKLFNMKVNLNKLKGKIDTLPMAGQVKISVIYPYKLNEEQNQNGQTDSRYLKACQEYLLKNDKLTLVQSNRPFSQSCPWLPNINTQQQLEYKGFLTIGASQKCNIVIPSTNVNEKHIKMIYATNLQQQGKSTHSFKIEPKPVNKVFIRDISTSNRCKYVIANENKYVVVKNGMILRGIGMIQDMFEIIIDAVPNAQPNDIKSLMDNLNADRKSFMVGEPDKPLKVCVNFDLESLNEGIIADLYDRNLYYPETKLPGKNKLAPLSGKQSQQKMRTPLKFRVINKRTLEQKKYDSKLSKQIIVGRDAEKCSAVIDHISIRSVEFMFEQINQIWFIRPLKTDIQKIRSSVAVFLTNNVSKNSNRICLQTEYPEYLSIKGGIQIKIEVKDRDHKEEQDY